MNQSRTMGHLLGFGLFLAWTLCMPGIRNQLAGAGGAPGSVGALVHGVVLIALAFVCNRRRTDLYSTRALVIGGVLATVAPLLSLAASRLPTSGVAAPAVAVVASLCEGSALALLYLLWNEQIARCPMRSSWPTYAASFALAPLAYFVLTPLPLPVSAVVTFALPVLSCILLMICAKQSASREPESETVSRSWRFPWRPALIMTVFSFAHFMLMHLAGGSAVMGQLGSLLAAGVLFAACTAGFDRFDPRLLYKLCPPLMVCALLLFTLGTNPLAEAAHTLAYAGFTGFSLFMAFVLSSICFRYGVHAAWLFGIVEGCSTLAHAAGSFAGKALLTWSNGSVEALCLPLDATVVALVLLSMLLLSERDFATTWGIRPAPAGPTMTDALTDVAERGERPTTDRSTTLVGDGTTREGLDARCARVARHFGLTRREEEVLTLLAQNRAAPDIEGELFISHNTAKGHIRHVYAKLGVHSREEAVEIVRNWR